MRQPLIPVAAAEPMPGWWNTCDRRDWFITAACGHSVIRRGIKPPKNIRCEGCS